MGTRTRGLTLLLLTIIGLSAAIVVHAQNSQPQVKVNYHEALDANGNSALQVYFTVQGSDGTILTNPPIKNVEILIDDQSYFAEVGKPDVSNPLFLSLALDVSGSMESTMTDLQNAAINAIESAPPEAQIAVLTFNEFIDVIQPFSPDHSQAAGRIRDLSNPYGGTCLYDAVNEAVEEVSGAVSGSPLARGAVILFTDGRDELTAGQGDTCSRRADLDDLLISPFPIYTIGLGGQVGANEFELRQIADETNGLVAIGAREDLNQLFQQIMIGLSSQLLAKSLLCLPQGTHEATLRVQFEEGTSDEVAIPFETTIDCIQLEETFLRVLQVDIIANEEQGVYTIEFVAENAPAVAQWQIRIINEQAGNTVDSYRYSATAGQPIQFTPDQLQPEAKYRVELSALDAVGQLLKNEDGKTTLAELTFVHWPEKAVVPAVTVDTIEIDRELGVFRVRLQIENKELIDRYTGQLINEDDKSLVRDLEPILTEDDSFEISLKGLQSADYLIEVNSLGEGNEVLATAVGEVKYLKPPVSFWQRLGLGLREYPFIPISIILVTLFIIVFLLWRSRQDKRATGMPWARARKLDSNQGTIHSPIDQTQLGGNMVSPEPDVYFEGPATPTPTLHSTATLQITRSPGLFAPNILVTVDHTPFTLGREGCDLNVPGDQRVSRNHAQIEQHNGIYYLQDMASINGTYLAGRKIEANRLVRLQNKAEIGLGRHTVVLFIWR